MNNLPQHGKQEKKPLYCKKIYCNYILTDKLFYTKKSIVHLFFSLYPTPNKFLFLVVSSNVYEPYAWLCFCTRPCLYSMFYVTRSFLEALVCWFQTLVSSSDELICSICIFKETAVV